MERKKILIVSRTFAPENSPRSFRTTELAKELARQGHEVHVLLPMNIQADVFDGFENNLGIVFLFYGPLKWKSLKKSKISWIGDWKRKFGRLLFLLFEYPNIEIYFKLPRVLKNLNGYDLMITIAVPHENHWAVSRVRTNKNSIAKTWVADCGDPFMGNVLETIRPPFYFRFFENRFLRKADFITVPTQGSVAAYNPKYSNKFRVIPQGFDFAEVNVCRPKPTHETPTFAYAGGVAAIGIRGLGPLIELLKGQDKPFVFHIFSKNATEALQNEVKDYEDSFVLHPAIPRQELLFELSKMDFLVNLDNGTTVCTPSKLIDYALVQRPILNINPFNPDPKIVNEFLDGNYENSVRVDNLEQYNIKNVADNFLGLA